MYLRHFAEIQFAEIQFAEIHFAERSFGKTNIRPNPQLHIRWSMLPVILLGGFLPARLLKGRFSVFWYSSGARARNSGFVLSHLEDTFGSYDQGDAGGAAPQTPFLSTSAETKSMQSCPRKGRCRFGSRITDPKAIPHPCTW